ncbi:aldo/keto reductase [Microbacterium sp. BWT-B31]|uniref:aldo/keto reductase n=1 Tax=Microbacterium sp. BWT-B31 TaxID=3232072 RepID=UPI00352809A9
MLHEENAASRHLGSLAVSAVGLGCMPLTMSYGASHRRHAGSVIGGALDLGVTHFDTSDMYGSGANERVVGAALGGDRRNVTLATKTGIRAIAGIPYRVTGSPKYIRRAVERSLRRLRTDWIDLYYLHRVDPQVPIEESIGAMSELVRAGLVREVGVSEVDGDQLRRAHAVHPLAAVQMEWSLFERGLERELLPAARDLGVAVTAYAPLGRGMLTSTVSNPARLGTFDIRRTLPRWRGASLPRHLTAATEINRIAQTFGASSGQLALAWLLAQGDDVVPIPGTTNPVHVEQNVRATQLRIDSATLRQVADIAADASHGNTRLDHR